MRRGSTPAIALVVSLAVIACGHGDAGRDARYPARPVGCDVTIYPGTPGVPTENIGPVRAACDPDVSKEDCQRTLKDQACKLGGDVVWQVDVEPTNEMGKNVWYGRAAHTKNAASPAK